jgi:hypothetical protein
MTSITCKTCKTCGHAKSHREMTPHGFLQCSLEDEPWRFWPVQHSCGGWKEVEDKERLAKRLQYFETRERLWNDGHPGN